MLCACAGLQLIAGLADTYVMCRRSQPEGHQMLRSKDFRAIASLNAMMYMTSNGTRSMLMPLLAIHQFGMSTTTLGMLL